MEALVVIVGESFALVLATHSALVVIAHKCDGVAALVSLSQSSPFHSRALSVATRGKAPPHQGMGYAAWDVAKTKARPKDKQCSGWNSDQWG